jgi:hypothetical protein
VSFFLLIGRTSFLSMLLTDLMSCLEEIVFLTVLVSSGMALHELVILEMSTSMLLLTKVSMELMPISLLVQSMKGLLSSSKSCVNYIPMMKLPMLIRYNLRHLSMVLSI